MPKKSLEKTLQNQLNYALQTAVKIGSTTQVQQLLAAGAHADKHSLALAKRQGLTEMVALLEATAKSTSRQTTQPMFAERAALQAASPQTAEPSPTAAARTPAQIKSASHRREGAPDREKSILAEMIASERREAATIMEAWKTADQQANAARTEGQRERDRLREALLTRYPELAEGNRREEPPQTEAEKKRAEQEREEWLARDRGGYPDSLPETEGDDRWTDYLLEAAPEPNKELDFTPAEVSSQHMSRRNHGFWPMI